jgi:activator of HSP90 ATPase
MLSPTIFFGDKRRMRKTFITTLVASAIAVVVLAGCKAQDIVPGAASSSKVKTDTNTNNAAALTEEARRVTVQELKDLLDKNEAVVYDTRSRMDYDSSHIKGALSMPVGEVETRIDELPKDKLIVFYCA